VQLNYPSFGQLIALKLTWELNLKISQIEKKETQNFKLHKICNFIENLFELIFTGNFQDQNLVGKFWLSVFRSENILTSEQKSQFLCKFVKSSYSIFKGSLISADLNSNIESEIHRITNSVLGELEETSQSFFERKKELQEQYRKTGRLETQILQSLEQLQNRVNSILVSVGVFAKKTIFSHVRSASCPSFRSRAESDPSV